LPDAHQRAQVALQLARACDQEMVNRLPTALIQQFVLLELGEPFDGFLQSWSRAARSRRSLSLRLS
jgi:hypothetical protein